MSPTPPPRSRPDPDAPNSADTQSRPDAPRENEAADPVGDGHSDADYAGGPPSTRQDGSAAVENTSIEAPDPGPRRR